MLYNYFESMREVFDFMDEVFGDVFGRLEEKKETAKKEENKEEEPKHEYSYYREDKYVNGKNVYHVEKETKDGEVLKNEGQTCRYGEGSIEDKKVKAETRLAGNESVPVNNNGEYKDAGAECKCGTSLTEKFEKSKEGLLKNVESMECSKEDKDRAKLLYNALENFAEYLDKVDDDDKDYLDPIEEWKKWYERINREEKQRECVKKTKDTEEKTTKHEDIKADLITMHKVNNCEGNDIIEKIDNFKGENTEKTKEEVKNEDKSACLGEGKYNSEVREELDEMRGIQEGRFSLKEEVKELNKKESDRLNRTVEVLKAEKEEIHKAYLAEIEKNRELTNRIENIEKALRGLA